jgi:hypothetical protein
MCHVLVLPRPGELKSAADHLRRQPWASEVKTKLFIGFDSVRSQFSPTETGLMVSTRSCRDASMFASDPVCFGRPQGSDAWRYQFSMRLQVAGSAHGGIITSLFDFATILAYIPEGSFLTKKWATHYIRITSLSVLDDVYAVLRSLSAEEVDERYAVPLFGERGGRLPIFSHPCSDVAFAHHQRQRLFEVSGVTHVLTTVDP